MKKKMILLLIVGSLVTACSNHDTSLQKAIEAKHEDSIQILNTYNGVVLYLENEAQYILGAYSEENGNFFYDHSESKGWVFDEKMLIRADSELGEQPVIFGVINDRQEDIEMFTVTYGDGIVQDVIAENNTFIAAYAGEIDDHSLLNARIERVEAKGEDGSVIFEYKK